MEQKVVVIGATNIDLIGYPHEEQLVSQDSNIGTVYKVFGGVGRNIAENLGLLGQHVSFITVVGDDVDGEACMQDLKANHVHVEAIKAPKSSYYMAVLDENRDMAVAINDMESIEALTPSFVMSHKALLEEATIVVLETNVAEDVIEAVMKLEKPIYVDVISIPKTFKIKDHLARIHTLKLNRYEAAALYDKRLSNQAKAKDAVHWLLEQGVKRVFLTLGKEGVLIGENNQVRHMMSKTQEVMSATGAGDAFIAGVIYGDLNKFSPVISGLSMAGLALDSLASVNPNITAKKLDELIKEYIL